MVLWSVRLAGGDMHFLEEKFVRCLGCLQDLFRVAKAFLTHCHSGVVCSGLNRSSK